MARVYLHVTALFLPPLPAPSSCPLFLPPLPDPSSCPLHTPLGHLRFPACLCKLHHGPPVPLKVKCITRKRGLGRCDCRRECA